VGYDPRALIAMLEVMKGHLKPGGTDFAKTHPSPADRIARLQKLITAPAAAPAPAVRTARMRKALSGV
jgi:predicted Zn-dependent protease